MTGQEARDEEREALIAVIDDPANWWYNGTHTVFSPSRGADALIAAGYRKHPEPDITDEMIDRAQQAFHDFTIGPYEPLTRREKGITRLAYRAALEAALRVPVGEGEQ